MTPRHGRDRARPVPSGTAPALLVSGCTGFIGSRLADRLSRMGYKVRGLTRQRVDGRDDISYVRADALDLSSLTAAMEGIDVAYYLIHSMEGSKSEWQNFAQRERAQAENFLKAAQEAKVKRIIYLGGLFGEGTRPSPHMKSRRDAGRILASGEIPVTELRASLIIGARGGSFAMLRYLVERLRVMACPSWVGSHAQPIAVDDVVAYLVGCLKKKETEGRIFEIGGPDKMTYEQLMRTYAAYLNRRLFVLRIPLLTTRLSSLWVDLVTPVRASLARPLIDSLVHDTVVTDASITKIIPLKLKTTTEAIDAAVREADSGNAGPKRRRERTGLGLNQRVVMLTLFALGVFGTSYYWLDDRPGVYGLPWLLGSAAWYAAILFAAVMAHNKTRLGYMAAGALSWVTLSFWLLDNIHVALDTSLISAEPGTAMTIRNFAGAAVAAVAVVASHNLFHKICDYRRGGAPA